MEIESVEIKILFFAKARELTELSESTISIPVQILCRDLRQNICDTFGLNEIKQNIILAKNSEYCDDLSALLEFKEGDELAVIPPLSGG